MHIERLEELLKTNPPLLAEGAKSVLERAYHAVGPLHATVSIGRIALVVLATVRV